MVIYMLENQKLLSSVDQINEAINQINEATTTKKLVDARDTASAFIQAAYEKEDIDLKQKHQYLKKVRAAYRDQYIGAA